MRFSALTSVALAAGVAAKPHARRQKSACSTPSSIQVPVPPPIYAAASTSSTGGAAPYPAPTGYDDSPSSPISSSIVVSSPAVVDVSSSVSFDSPLSSIIDDVSSSVTDGVSSSVADATSSAIPSETTAPTSTVPIGQAIFACTEPGTFALTYDDGPFAHTNHVLDLLAETDIKATFFVNGNNWANINDYQDVVRRMIADGHQIGSHTYGHPNLATLGAGEVIKTMTDLEDALDAIIGEIPTYMRPPFFSYNDQTLSVLGDLGYHVIISDIDTLDYEFRTIGDLTGAENLQNGLDAGGRLALAHDVHQNTAEVLTPEFIRIIQESGLRGVTVGECLGDPEENWYRPKRATTPTASSGPSSTVSITSTSTPTGPVDVNGACGGDTGFFCAPGACCSEHGYCGASIAYCGAGCQPEFGVCGVNVPVS